MQTEIKRHFEMRDVHATLGGHGGAIAQLQAQVQAQELRMDGVEALGGARVALGGARSGVLLDEPALPMSPALLSPRARAAGSSPAMPRPLAAPSRRPPLSPRGGSNPMRSLPPPGSSLRPADAACETAPAAAPASGARSISSTHSYTQIYTRDQTRSTGPCISTPSCYQTCTTPLTSHYTPYIPLHALTCPYMPLHSLTCPYIPIHDPHQMRFPRAGA